ncbi:MAG: GNAT family N-acetyltransferase [Vicinamibacterales bacterium]
MPTLKRLHDYWHANARAHAREVIDASPFTLYLGTEADPRYTERDASYNVVIANDDADLDLASLLAQIRARVRASARPTHIEIIEELFPRLSAALVPRGFLVVVREPLLVCTPAMLRPVTDIPGLTYITLTRDSPMPEIREGMDVNERGFDPGFVGPTSEQDAERFRRTLGAARAFTARQDGVAAAAGMHNVPFDGVTRLVGIATLEPFRRRGIAAALTAQITRSAFDSGVDLAFLAAASDDAQRVYERIGYRVAGTIVGLDDRIVGT